MRWIRWGKNTRGVTGAGANEGERTARLSPGVVSLLADLALLFCALLWGMSFSAVKSLLSIYASCWLLFLRFSSGSVLLFLFFHRRILRTTHRDMIGGGVIGLALFAAITLQTVGLNFMDAGRQAFLVATYVLLVPLLLWAIRRTFPGWVTLGAACVCLLGMRLLTLDASGPVGLGEALSLLCAVVFAGQIIAISHYAAGTTGDPRQGGDPIALTFVEFAVVAVLSLLAALAIEEPLILRSEGLPELAFTIVFCTFLCYLVQICAQKYARPSHAAIIMSLESVFGLLGGVVFLGEEVTLRMALGCVLIFASVLLVELEPFLKGRR